MELSNLNKSYNGKAVLSDFSYKFNDGTTCIMGRSGCGKTTLLNIISGITKPDGGNISGVPRNISLIWQDDRLLNWLANIDNIMLPKDAKEPDYAVFLAKKMGVFSELQKRPLELSGGQRRRIAIIRALMPRYPLILMDEPFLGLDEQTKFGVMQTVKEEILGKTAIIVTHDKDEALFFSKNPVLADGPPLSITQRN